MRGPITVAVIGCVTAKKVGVAGGRRAEGCALRVALAAPVLPSARARVLFRFRVRDEMADSRATARSTCSRQRSNPREGQHEIPLERRAGG